MRYNNFTFTTASDLASDACFVNKSDRISHALDLMEKNKVSQLLVMNDGEVVGILTKQGIARTLGAIDDLSLIHISEPTRRTPISYAVFCLKKKKENETD